MLAIGAETGLKYIENSKDFWVAGWEQKREFPQPGAMKMLLVWYIQGGKKKKRERETAMWKTSPAAIGVDICIKWFFWSNELPGQWVYNLPHLTLLTLTGHLDLACKSVVHFRYSLLSFPPGWKTPCWLFLGSVCYGSYFAQAKFL